MNERAFRLDFLIGVAALLVSAASALALIYQTHVVGDQYASTIWPYLTVTNDIDSRQVRIVLTNDGTGPALIHSAQLEVNGRASTSWTAYLSGLEADAEKMQPALSKNLAFTARGVGEGTTLRAGDSLTLFSASFGNRLVSSALVAAMLKRQLVLRFCYCSLNGSCWDMHSSSANPLATHIPIRGCEQSAIITASLTDGARVGEL